MNTIRITTTQNIELEYELANTGDRIVATVIDTIIKYVYLLVSLLVMTNIYDASLSNLTIFQNISMFCIMLPFIFYNLLCESLLNGQSIGKKALKLKVISLDNFQPTFGQFMIRWLFRLIDIWLCYGLCALISSSASTRKQRIGDMVAGTTVIRTKPRSSFEQTFSIPVIPENYQVTFQEAGSLADKDIQLLKEIVNNVQQYNNIQLAFHTAEKVKRTLQIESTLGPVELIKTVITDHHHITSEEV